MKKTANRPGGNRDNPIHITTGQEYKSLPVGRWYVDENSKYKFSMEKLAIDLRKPVGTLWNPYIVRSEAEFDLLPCRSGNYPWYIDDGGIPKQKS